MNWNRRFAFLSSILCLYWWIAYFSCIICGSMHRFSWIVCILMTRIDIWEEIIFTATCVVILAHHSPKNQTPIILNSGGPPHTHCSAKPIDTGLYPQALSFLMWMAKCRNCDPIVPREQDLYFFSLSVWAIVCSIRFWLAMNSLWLCWTFTFFM